MKHDDYILITGGSGFIGSHLIDFLINNGYRNVISLDRNKRSPILYRNSHCTYCEGNIENKQSFESVFYKYPIKYIFHLSGNSNVPLSNEQPYLDFESNALGSLNLFQIAKQFEINKIIFTSSASVYGPPIYCPVTESHPLNPISNYALTKLYGEKMAIAYNNIHNINSSVVRIFSTYGPRQPRYVIYDILKKLSADFTKLEMMGSPDTIRDYIYIQDTVSALYQIMIQDNTNGEVFNLSSGQTISIVDLVKMICSILQIDPVVTFTGTSWKGDIKIFNGDISKLEKYTGFAPKIDLHKGLSETINWFREHEFYNL